jgi:hypothetical protein
VVKSGLQVGDLVSPIADTLVRSVPQATYHSRGRVREWKESEIGVLLEVRQTKGGEKGCALLDGEQWWILVYRLRRAVDP